MKKLILIFMLFVTCSISKIYAAKVDTLSIASSTMGKTYGAAVVLPNSYAKSKANYPVLYLLHGAYGHFNDWLKSTPNKDAVKNLADKYNIIIVMPEGETFSFYIDSPVLKSSQFETYITNDVVTKIDQTYRTVKDRKGRAITGLSMGGHGAMYLSTRHPELFCAAGTMSGAMDMAGLRNPKDPAQSNKMLESVYGTTPPTDQELASHAVLGMVEKIKANNLQLVMDCGVDDFLIESNRELHRRLVYAKVPHDYTERPGAHTWEYWQNSIPYHVYFFSQVFDQNGVSVK